MTLNATACIMAGIWNVKEPVRRMVVEVGSAAQMFLTSRCKQNCAEFVFIAYLWYNHAICYTYTRNGNDVISSSFERTSYIKINYVPGRLAFTKNKKRL